jgi:hypothetical protein
MVGFFQRVCCKRGISTLLTFENVGFDFRFSMFFNGWALLKGCVDTKRGTLAFITLKILGWILDFEFFSIVELCLNSTLLQTDARQA